MFSPVCIHDLSDEGLCGLLGRRDPVPLGNLIAECEEQFLPRERLVLSERDMEPRLIVGLVELRIEVGVFLGDEDLRTRGMGGTADQCQAVLLREVRYRVEVHADTTAWV